MRLEKNRTLCRVKGYTIRTVVEEPILYHQGYGKSNFKDNYSTRQAPLLQYRLYSPLKLTNNNGLSAKMVQAQISPFITTRNKFRQIDNWKGELTNYCATYQMPLPPNPDVQANTIQATPTIQQDLCKPEYTKASHKAGLYSSFQKYVA